MCSIIKLSAQASDSKRPEFALLVLVAGESIIIAASLRRLVRIKVGDPHKMFFAYKKHLIGIKVQVVAGAQKQKACPVKQHLQCAGKGE